MNEQYEPLSIEKTAQQYWASHHCFDAREDVSREKFYCLAMLPYPSGDLHMGHVRVYTITDVLARYHRLTGKNVMQPMGWDAFGLPAENAAIKNQLPPIEWTKKNISRMRKQLQQLGFGYDWKREVTTCLPSYYRWEQWLFIQLFKKNLAYRKNAIVNWDPVDKTVLANEQVIDGKGWRSGVQVEQREITQWFFRITDYAEELLQGLKENDKELKYWPTQVKEMQSNWIGRSEGVKVIFPVVDQKNNLEIFTTRIDTLMGVTYIAIAPEHPLAHQAAKKNRKLSDFLHHGRTSVAEADIATQEKNGINTGYFALHPITHEKLPIWVTNFVLMDYGTGALMAVPAHDQRDFEFAQKYHLPTKQVIALPKKKTWDTQSAYTGPGVLINSEQFDGLSSTKAKKVITEFLISNNLGEKQINYRLRDWGISRQRYWGAPIPIIYCKKCDIVPVPEDQLPVILPEDLVPDGHGSPLAKCDSFINTKCPQCGGDAKRETDTMDTFVESSWYYARYCSFDQNQSMLDDRAKYWTPVDQYVGGIEHAVMHLLYVRFFHKVLRDLNLLNSNEPFTHLLTQGMVLKSGAKMSKSKGNVVTPQCLIKKYGADTARFFMIFAAPPDQSLEWSDSGVEGAHRFLKRVWALAYQFHGVIQTYNQQEIESSEIDDPQFKVMYKQIHDVLQQATQDIQRLQLNTVASACMKLFNILSKLTTHSDIEIQLIHEGLSILLRILSPIAPHLCHQLWRDLNYGDNILDARWPKINARAQAVTEIEMVVQINGKLRGHILIPSQADQTKIEKTALEDERIKSFIDGKPIKKIIVVPKRLVNIVI